VVAVEVEEEKQKISLVEYGYYYKLVVADEIEKLFLKKEEYINLRYRRL